MERFIVRKNTLPYIHQWAVLDTKTGNTVGDFKTWPIAVRALKSYAVTAYRKLKEENDMRRPDGDPPPKPPKHSDKRRVELD